MFNTLLYYILSLLCLLHWLQLQQQLLFFFFPGFIFWFLVSDPLARCSSFSSNYYFFYVRKNINLLLFSLMKTGTPAARENIFSIHHKDQGRPTSHIHTFASVIFFCITLLYFITCVILS